MKNKKLSKFISLFCAASIMLSGLFWNTSAVSGAAVDYDAKIRELEAEAEKIQKKVKESEALIEKYKDDMSNVSYYKQIAEGAVNDLLEEIKINEELINAKQDAIDKTVIEINDLENDILSTELDIEDKKIIIQNLHKENEKNIETFGQIIRLMYMNENFDMIALLADAADFFDLLVRTELMTNIGEKNLEFMNSLLADVEEQDNVIKELENQEAKLKRDKTNCEQIRLKLENERLELEDKKSSLKSNMVDAESKLYAYASDITAMQNKVNNLRSTITASNDEVEEINNLVAEFIREKSRQASGQPVYSTDGFRWPLEKKFQMITTYFGYDAWRSGNHYGIDVGNAGINGSNIYAAQSGTVIRNVSGDSSMWGGGFGNYIIIDHGNGITTVYAHCQAWSIKFAEGDTVEKGDVIALIGSTGWATGPHLHFEVRVNGNPVNPFNYGYEYV